MKKTPLLLFIAFFLASALPSASFAGRIFAYTHSLPSPLTLPAGRLVYGTEFAYGATDFLQIGTNALRDAYRIFNANAKLGLLELESFALSPFISWETFNYRFIDPSNPDLRVTSLMPGAVAAVALDPAFALFVGGNLNITKTRLVDDGVSTSGLMRGAVLQSDISWAYAFAGAADAKTRQNKNAAAPRPARGSAFGNVLSAGISYDLSYKLFGMGISHHWRGLHLGVHYYPKATRFSLQPIVAGGGSVDL